MTSAEQITKLRLAVESLEKQKIKADLEHEQAVKDAEGKYQVNTSDLLLSMAQQELDQADILEEDVTGELEKITSEYKELLVLGGYR